jgi:hypothetical protein
MNYSIPYSYYPFPSMSWFARLKQVVFHEPKDKKQLVTECFRFTSSARRFGEKDCQNWTFAFSRDRRKS